MTSPAWNPKMNGSDAKPVSFFSRQGGYCWRKTFQTYLWHFFVSIYIIYYLLPGWCSLEPDATSKTQNMTLIHTYIIIHTYVYIYHYIYITYSRFCQRKQSMFPNMEPSPRSPRWGLRSYFAEAVSENVTVPPETSLENFTHWLLGKPRRGWCVSCGKKQMFIPPMVNDGEIGHVWPTLPHYLILMWQSHEASLK